MKNYIINLVKTNESIKTIYTCIGNTVLRFIGLFVKTEKNLILFNSFGGKKYDDSPKALYEYMINDKRFKSYKFVWAFHEPQNFTVPYANIIKTDSLQYFITALKSKVWISNSGIERGLSFKKKKTIYINTWHGTPLKLMGQDFTKKKIKFRFEYDLQCAQSDYEARIFSRAFNIPIENFLVCGLPRNDILANTGEEMKNLMKQKLSIPQNKKVILYAPTFREYERDEKRNCFIKPPIDFKKWKKELGDEYCVLLRLHYEIVSLFTDDFDNSFVKDVSDYHTLNDLMIASDILITDYSSIMFDYSILGRPIYIFAYDYKEYSSKRGMYFNICDKLIGGNISEDELLKLIKNTDYKFAVDKVQDFRSKYVTAFGNATKLTVDKIYELIKKENL